MIKSLRKRPGLLAIPLLLVLWIAVPRPASATHSATFLGPSPYLSFDDSPFNGAGLSDFYLEDFEDGVLGVPGVTATGNSLGGPSINNGGITDSVELMTA